MISLAWISRDTHKPVVKRRKGKASRTIVPTSLSNKVKNPSTKKTRTLFIPEKTSIHNPLTPIARSI